MEYPAGYWLNDDSRLFLSRDYLPEGVTPEERIRVIALAAEGYLRMPGFADKFERYMLNGWISLASPVWSNFGTDRGLPISCNGSYMEDSVPSILMKTAEIGMMTKLGAGTSAYVGSLRRRGSIVSSGGKADGPVHYLECVQTNTSVISQAAVRRGSCAVYLDIEHPDVEEYLECREEGSVIQTLNLGLCVGDAWMQSMINGDRGKIDLWRKVLRKRFETGYPYIFFTDTVNRDKPVWYSDNKIHASNLCTEIALPSSREWSFVCCLSSLNLLHYHEWKDTDLVEVMTWFLDAVMEEYIRKIGTLEGDEAVLMAAAGRFARENRAVGLGVLGWHSLLQRSMIPYESLAAKRLNVEVWRLIDDRSRAASLEAGKRLGAAPVVRAAGYQYRNATRLAVAPTTSSSFILGQVSPSTEPENSNYYIKDLQKGKFTHRNPFLKELLGSKGMDTPEVWRSVLLAGGSVQHLEGLTPEERAVFKTFGEIDQSVIVEQTAARQRFIDQAQSMNLMVHPDTPMKEVNALLIQAWRSGVKTCYYQRSTNPSQEYVRNLISCASCEA